MQNDSGPILGTRYICGPVLRTRGGPGNSGPEKSGTRKISGPMILNDHQLILYSGPEKAEPEINGPKMGLEMGGLGGIRWNPKNRSPKRRSPKIERDRKWVGLAESDGIRKKRSPKSGIRNICGPGVGPEMGGPEKSGTRRISRPGGIQIEGSLPFMGGFLVHT